MICNGATAFLLLSAISLSACGEELGGSLGESGTGKSSHNTGRNCKECHSATYAGSVYQDGGARTAPGAVIVITESGGSVIEVVADASGNFYTQRGAPSGGYSATVQGNSMPMVTQPTSGACSAGGCHDGSSVPVVYQN